MADTDHDPAPLEAFVLGLTELLYEADVEEPGGFVRVERFAVAMPLEVYPRADPERPGSVLAVECRPPLATLTSVMPILHQLSLSVEVASAEQRQPSLEP